MSECLQIEGKHEMIISAFESDIWNTFAFVSRGG